MPSCFDPQLFKSKPSDKKQEPVDLHSKEFCVDVSAYKPLQWVEMEGQDCKTEFVTRCQEKRENVCAKVMETQCEVNT